MKKKNTAILPHPWSIRYWKEAVLECKNLRSLVYAAFLCAVAIILEKFNVQLTDTLQVSISFFATALCSMLTGPVLAIGCGIVVDLIGIIGSPYPVFFGYTLTAVLTAVVYSLFLYRAKVTYLRVLLCEFCINLFINVLLGSVWRIMMQGGAYWVYVSTSGIKNLLLLLPEAFLLCLFLKALSKPLIHLGVLAPQAEIEIKKHSFLISLVITLLGTGLVFWLAY